MEATRFKPTAIKIPEGDPFKEDLLSRKESADALTDFVASLREPFVLSIDSPWGTGKTTFLKMWLQHLRNQGFPCLYFNAWENDFSASPLVALIGELGTAIDTLRLGDKSGKLAGQVFNKTKRAAAALLKAALPTAIKLATSGVLDLSAVTEEELSKLAEDIAKTQIEKYQADKNTIEGFRKELGELVKSLAGDRGVKPERPLVFVIDELDRCRPPYAIELLEKVKHLFSIDGLVFVIAVDREQLDEAVRSLYGFGMDADGYLRRFIDLEYRLPEPDPNMFSQAQFGRFGLDSILKARDFSVRSDSDALRSALPELFSVFGFSLRVQEQCFTQLSVVLRTTPPNYLLYGYLLAILICVRSANLGLYLAYCRGDASPQKVLEYVSKLPRGSRFSSSRLSHLIEANLVLGIRDYDKRRAEVESYERLAKADGTEDEKRTHVKTILQYMQWNSHQSDDMTGYLFRKIELAQRFIQPG